MKIMWGTVEVLVLARHIMNYTYYVIVAERS